jgi:hypothetical protein
MPSYVVAATDVGQDNVKLHDTTLSSQGSNHQDGISQCSNCLILKCLNQCRPASLYVPYLQIKACCLQMQNMAGLSSHARQ